jgi:hypothetical protein
MENNTKVENESNKTLHKRTYMREYKRKQYETNGELMRQKNKAYYCKYKYNLNSDDMKRYDVLLPLITKLTICLEELKIKNPTFLKEIVEKYN